MKSIGLALLFFIGLISNSSALDIINEQYDDYYVTRTKDTASRLSLHQPNYFDVVSWSDQSSFKEITYQLSAKFNLVDNLYFAYTQNSYWELYDRLDSRPFRETNYQPEIFYRVAPDKTGWLMQTLFDVDSLPIGFDFGFVHESNGEDIPLSRSWNRLFVEPFWQSENHFAAIKLWYRLPEEKRKDETKAAGDDNPDILDYYGYSKFTYKYRLPDAYNNIGIGLYLGGNIATKRGSTKLEVTIPFAEDLYLMVSGFTGYGYSLQNYNKSTSSAGFGLMLKR